MENSPAMQTKIVGVYESHDHADNAADLLVKKGIPREQIYFSNVGAHKSIPEHVSVQESLFEELKDFYHSLFDDMEEEKIEEAYTRMLKKKNIVVSVDMQDEDQAKKIAAFIHETYGSSHATPAKKTSSRPSSSSGKEKSHPENTNPDKPASLAFTNIFDKQKD